MKRILVVSDSHGGITNMNYAIRKEDPDMVIHLGDCMEDARQLKELYPRIPMEGVPGNCDGTMAGLERIIEVEGKKILLCHGHTYQVKSGYLQLQYAALEKGVDIALFGHTHKVFYDHHNGLWMMNPGSITAPPAGIPVSYGILTLDATSGIVNIDIRYIERN